MDSNNTTAMDLVAQQLAVWAVTDEFGIPFSGMSYGTKEEAAAEMVGLQALDPELFQYLEVRPCSL